MTITDKTSANTPQSIHVNQNPIGVFDSGVGGLSIAKCIHEQLPNEQLIYVADSMHAPYGDKSGQNIQQRVNRIARYLIEQQAKAIVIACNTATVNAIDQLRETIDIPIIGVEPAIKPASVYTKSKRIGILVTESTAVNPRFQDLVNRFSNGVEVFIQPCPGLMEIVESGDIDSDDCLFMLSHFILPMIERNIDTLVLGCTHYTFLSEKITRLFGQDITLMETALPVTQELKRQLERRDLLANKRLNQHQFLTTKHSQPLSQLFNHLWQQELSLNNLSL